MRPPDRIDQKLAVPYSFPVLFTRDAFSPRNTALLQALPAPAPGEPPPRVLVAIERDLAASSGPFPDLPRKIAAWFSSPVRRRWCTLAAPPLLLPGGEACKQDASTLVLPLLEALRDAAICRHSVCVAVGGGAFLDAAGLAAALFHRGVRLVRLPTTALSQGDSGVGVKNAVNWHGSKNLLGTFAPPWAVVNDSAFLEKLPLSAKLDGVAEAIKVAAIRSAPFFLQIERSAPSLALGKSSALLPVIRESALLHARHIATSGDPFEMGTARPLDYGHWIAHKLETLSGHRITHGHAVSIGIATDALYAAAAGFLPERSALRLVNTLRACGLPATCPEILLSASRPARPAGTPADLLILQGLEEFRAHLGGRLTLTMPSPRLGRSRDIHTLDPALLHPILLRLASLP